MNKIIPLSLSFLNIFLFSVVTTAGGFQIWQQSGSSTGDNTAGAAAIANDATTAYYNPAGLPRVQYQDFAFSVIGKISSVKFDGQVETNTTHSGIIQCGKTLALPNLQYAAPINKKLGFGFNITTPFASKFDYGRHAFTNNLITRLSLYTTNMGLSLGYKITDNLSFGMGIDAEYLDFEFNRMDDSNSKQTGFNKNEFSNWAWGFNGGGLLEISPNTRVGFSYRSKITHHASGTSRFENISDNEVNKTRVKSTLILPPSTTFSIYHDITKQFTLLGSISHTKWRDLKHFYLENVASANAPINVDIQKYSKNSWNFSVGAHYKVDTHTTLRMGTGYDQTPTTKDSRNLMIPDANRYILSLGAGHQFTKKVGLDIGYSHIIMRRTNINHAQMINTQNITTTGHFDNSDDILGIQFNWKMT